MSDGHHRQGQPERSPDRPGGLLRTAPGWCNGAEFVRVGCRWCSPWVSATSAAWAAAAAAPAVRPAGRTDRRDRQRAKIGLPGEPLLTVQGAVQPAQWCSAREIVAACRAASRASVSGSRRRRRPFQGRPAGRQDQSLPLRVPGRGQQAGGGHWCRWCSQRSGLARPAGTRASRAVSASPRSIAIRSISQDQGTSDPARNSPPRGPLRRESGAAPSCAMRQFSTASGG